MTLTPSMRLAKFIARAGACSRREAEKIILEGRVYVDGQRIDHPLCLVNETQHIVLDGRCLALQPTIRLWRFYKPRGYLTTRNDPENRPIIYDLLDPLHKNLLTVGRLDYHSEGLLLLTNHGGLARTLEHPKTGWLRDYRVKVRGKIDSEKLKSLKNGIEIDGFRYAPIKASIIKTSKDKAPKDKSPNNKAEDSNCWLHFILSEGKNREIRKICEHFGHPVMRLIRTHFGSFGLEDLEPGQIQEIPPEDLKKGLSSVVIEAK